MTNHTDIETAQFQVIKTALRKGRKYDNLAKNYGDFLKKLRAEKNPNDYIKSIAVIIQCESVKLNFWIKFLWGTQFREFTDVLGFISSTHHITLLSRD